MYGHINLPVSKHNTSLLDVTNPFIYGIKAALYKPPLMSLKMFHGLRTMNTPLYQLQYFLQKYPINLIFYFYISLQTCFLIISLKTSLLVLNQQSESIKFFHTFARITPMILFLLQAFNQYYIFHAFTFLSI